tara:strand:+ start:37 stop:225 length:189 start_codon:yes stop_codon:yes gene_type:complete
MVEDIDEVYLKKMLDDILEVMDTIHKEVQDIKIKMIEYHSKSEKITPKKTKTTEDVGNLMFQ